MSHPTSLMVTVAENAVDQLEAGTLSDRELVERQVMLSALQLAAFALLIEIVDSKS